MVKTIIKYDEETEVQEARPELMQPSLFQVLLHNDNFTPMEFVVNVLERFFNMNTTRATQVMYEIHNSGKASCGVFTKDVAETKVDAVRTYAQRHDHPLLCSLEAM